MRDKSRLLLIKRITFLSKKLNIEINYESLINKNMNELRKYYYYLLSKKSGKGGSFGGANISIYMNERIITVSSNNIKKGPLPPIELKK